MKNYIVTINPESKAACDGALVETRPLQAWETYDCLRDVMAYDPFVRVRVFELTPEGRREVTREFLPNW